MSYGASFFERLFIEGQRRDDDQGEMLETNNLIDCLSPGFPSTNLAWHHNWTSMIAACFPTHLDPLDELSMAASHGKLVR